MTTVEYLEQIGKLNSKINNKLVEIEQARIMACSISAINYDERVQTSPDFDKIGKVLSKIENMEIKLNKLIDVYVDTKNYIIGQIESLDDVRLSMVLFGRYVKKDTYEKIAEDINYSVRQTKRLHDKAILAFEDKYYSEYVGR